MVLSLNVRGRRQKKVCLQRAAWENVFVCLSVCLSVCQSMCSLCVCYLTFLLPYDSTSLVFLLLPQPNRSLLKSLLQLVVNMMVFQRTSSPCRWPLLKFNSTVSALHLLWACMPAERVDGMTFSMCTRTLLHTLTVKLSPNLPPTVTCVLLHLCWCEMQIPFSILHTYICT